MDDCLEQKVRTCELCQLNRPPDHPVTVHPWEFPKKPWVRLHIDYAGPVMGKMFLVLIDAHSKWLEVKVVSSATSSVTMQHLRSIFSTHGLPEILVSDNGSCFTSHEFGQFMRNNGIRHICTAPYHPASNGQAERAVKIVKQALKNCTKDAVETQLSRFLFHYRLTPQTTTGVSPAELLLRRRPRSQLDLAKPDLHQHIASKQTVPPPKKGGGKKEVTLGVDSPVLVRNFGTGQSWLAGTVKHSSGPRSFVVELTDGRLVRRHINHIRLRHSELNPPDKDDAGDGDWPDTVTAPQERQAIEVALPDAHPVTAPHGPTAPTRRSGRVRHPPDYLSHRIGT